MSNTNNLQQRLTNSDTDWSSDDNVREVYCHQFRSYDNIEQEINANANANDTLKKAWTTAKSESSDQSDGAIAKYCYTLEEPNFYRELNSSIRHCFKKNDFSQFPYPNFMALLSAQTITLEKITTVYRGISFDKQPIAAVGQLIYSNQFESCSLSDGTAKNFVGDGTLYVISTPIAIVMGKDSAYPREQEYVIRPFVAFRVDKVDRKSGQRKYNIIHLTVVKY